VQVAQLHAARLDAYDARSEHEVAARSVADSERSMKARLASFNSRVGSAQVFSAQEVQWWRAALAAAIRDVDIAVQLANDANEELEKMRQALSVAEAKVRLLESALKTAQRHVARGREALAFADSEHLRRPRELQP
jgi:hypothetical protein